MIVMKDNMNIHTSLSTFPSSLSPVVTVGMFDGVHIGHHSVLQQVVRLAEESGTESVVVTFDPHPRHVLDYQADVFKILTTVDEKARLMEDIGIQHLVVLPFHLELAAMSPEEFAIGVLVNGLNASHIVMGPDHHFGRNRQGSLETLRGLAEQYHFEVHQLSPQLVENAKVSSTEIRKALAAGDLDRAWLFLGYPYPLSGKVVEGDKIGRSIGFPTLNLDVPPEKLIPGNGVYAVLAEFGQATYEGMCNIGVRPTVYGDHLTVEVNLFGFDREIYGETVRVAFMEKIRDERKFGSLHELRLQLENDRETVKDALKTED